MFVSCFLITATVYADTTQQQIDKARDEITDLQQQKEDAENKVDSLNDEKVGLEQDLSGLNGELNAITAAMNQVEADIAAKEQEITEAEKELEAAETKSAEQYEAMKLRIQFMYENGNITAFVMLLESQSITDFLNRTEYISELNQYDRQMLTEFQELTEQIAKQKEELEGEREELLALQEKKQTEQENVNRLIADTQEKIEQSNQKLTEAQSNVDELSDELARMIAYEEELEIQKAKEDAARLAAIREQEKEDTSQNAYVPAESDSYLLGAIIECEAGGESYEGKLAVGSVIINRVKSSYFPNTVSGVIYQSGQFSPVASGRLAYRLEAGVSSECLQAAEEVLGGNITTNCLYFRTNNGIIEGMVIGNHVFY